jgi:outer membrane receptor protein involved in Fe transport
MRRIRYGLILGILISGTALNTAWAADLPVQFNLPAQPLADSIRAVAREAQLNVVVNDALIAGKLAPAFRERATAEEALGFLLRDTGLVWERYSEKGIRVGRATEAGEGVNSDDPQQDKGFKSAAAQTTGDSAPASPSSEGEADKLTEIIVTGTHIRGATNPASPVRSYTRDEVDLSGVGNVQQFVRRLPQNFNGGASDETVGSLAGGGSSQNSVGASGINLRGLGSEATLVLVNGHRLAPANVYGNFTDISMIPVTAVDRVEVVSDGASAIYGSDAVGGVINFVLRRDFEGAETRLRYGATSDGGGSEIQVGQTLGRSWDGGGALLSYEYLDRDPIEASDRSYTDASLAPFTLVPSQKRHSVFFNSHHALQENIEVFAEGSFAKRASLNYVSNIFARTRGSSDISAYTGTVGARLRLQHDLQLEMSASYGASDTDRDGFTNAALSSVFHTNTSTGSGDIKLDGSLFDLPAGSVRFALGGQARKEAFETREEILASHYDADRNIYAAFAELNVPLLGPQGSSSTNRLELSLAHRYEHYEDFGATNNPKIGLSWRPLNALKLRATYGESFRAPQLNETNPVPDQVAAQTAFNPATGADADYLLVEGGNPNLRPQTAKSWTLGFDWAPEFASDLQLSATYYRIDYKRLITTAGSAGLDIFAPFDAPGLFGALYQPDPSLAQVQDLVSSTTFFDFTNSGNVDLAAIEAIIDGRSQNLSKVKTDGIDLNLTYGSELRIGKLNTGIDATYILNFDRQLAASMPQVSILSTQYNPVDLRLRAHGILEHRNFTAALYANYVDSYEDTRSVPASPVGSWTTFDLTAGLKFGPESAILDGASASLSILNLADKRPPYVRSLAPAILPGLVFDGANANIWGRTIALQLAYKW